MTDWTPQPPLSDDDTNVGFLFDLLERPAWHRKASCRGLGDLFFAVTKAELSVVQEAKNVCRACPVIGECRVEALKLPYAWPGVWGGWSQKERCEHKAAQSRGAA